MSIKITELPNLTPTANTILFAVDDQVNPNTAYKLSMSSIRIFTSGYSYSMANAAYDHANSAFMYANTSNSYANFVYDYADSAFYTANVADSKVENTNFILSYCFNTANAAFIASNSAFDLSNTINSQIDYISQNLSGVSSKLGLAYNHANSAYAYSNVAYIHANSAFELANANYSNAFSANNLSNIAINNSEQALQDSNTALILAQSAFDRSNSSIDLSSNSVFAIGSLQQQANTISSDFNSYVLSTDIINLKSVGVIGDGTGDDTNSIQAILDDSEAKTIYVPQGTYMCNTLYVSSNTVIVGSGLKSTFVCNNPNTTLFSANTLGKNSSDIKISNISIVTEYSGCNAMYFYGNTELGVCSGINISDIDINGNFRTGILSENCENIVVQNSSINTNNDIVLSNTTISKLLNNNLKGISNNILEISSNYNIITGNMLWSNSSISGANTVFANNIEL